MTLKLVSDSTPEEKSDLDIVAYDDTEKVIVLGDERFPMEGTFKLGKTMRLAKLLGVLINQTATGLNIVRDEDGNIESGWIAEAVLRLFSEADELLTRLLAVAIIPDATFARLKRESKDVTSEIARVEALLEEHAEPADAVKIVHLAIDCMGVDAVKGNVEALMARFFATNKTDEPNQGGE